MADLYQYRNEPEEPLDCLYIIQCSGSDPLDGLEFSAKDRKCLKQKAKALAPRGEEGELISGECPLSLAHRLTFVGVGEEKKLTHSKLRTALSRVMSQATKNREYQIGLAIPVGVHGLTDGESRLFALREASVADYTFDVFKSKKNEFDKIDGLHIIPLKGETEEELEERLNSTRMLRTSIQLTRDLVNRPGNDLTPEGMAAAANEMASGVNGLRVTVLGMKELQKEKMGGIMGVAQGSAEEPRLVVIEHRPKKPKKSIVIVGKGVTFDTGGISLKPAKSMETMKCDMAGAATVIGIMRAVAHLELPLKVVGLVPTAENMPSGTAIKPGDVLTMASGKTVEVDNTDAEGRLLLREIGENVGERVWPLPLYDEYLSYLKSDWADFKNTGSRWGGAVTAGTFLKQFVPEKVSWAHIDVAGVAYNEKEHNGLPTGASGFGVVLTVAFLEQLLK
jgi:leucyl aminopeptidase